MRCEVWGGCAWINLDDDAPPLRQCIEPMATVLDAWKVESLRAEWWYACRLPVNWKLAEEAFVEQYHVLQSHPQLRIPGRLPTRDPADFDPRAFVEAELHYLRVMSEGMAGMVHANDVAVAESVANMELPADYALARTTWQRALNDAVTRAHRARGCDIPDLNELEEQRPQPAHGLLLPPLLRPAHVLERLLVPVPTARPRGDPHGDLVAHPVPRGRRARDPAGPRAVGARRPAVATHPGAGLLQPAPPAAGLHARSFEYMRLSERNEGHISNYQRVIDGFLAGLPYEQLLPALAKINVNPLEMPIVEIGF